MNKTYAFLVKPTLLSERLYCEDGLTDVPESVQLEINPLYEECQFPLPWDGEIDVQVGGDKTWVVMTGAAGANGFGYAEVRIPLDEWVASPPCRIRMAGTWDMFTELIGLGWEVSS
jgi:hypothetical protein